MKKQFLIYCVKENVGYFETFKEALVNEMNTRGKRLIVDNLQVLVRMAGAAMVMRQPGKSLSQLWSVIEIMEVMLML